ncbi:LexA family transcriptional regulator [Fusobacterium varium]|uniref:LexA family transcriptional regulator n=1 Tax=Fusobacterium varium TaxID=856 RepID=UPI00242E1E54|nr:LexA family transcriptional regulator [Fusobacterium varium]
MTENLGTEIKEELRIKLGNYIEELRNKRNYGFNQLAVKSGVNVKSLNEIINGKAKKVNPFHLKKIAKALNVDYREFYKIVEYLDADEKIVPNAEITFNFKKVPVFENISAGYGAVESEIIDYISLPNYQGTFSGDIFAVQVHGDSMENTIEDKSIVFIKKEPEIQNKKIGAFIVNNQAYLKRYFEDEHGIFLRSDNREYRDIEIKESDDFIVVGKYIGSFIKEN